jgi:hypothetical protein
MKLVWHGGRFTGDRASIDEEIVKNEKPYKQFKTTLPVFRSDREKT